MRDLRTRTTTARTAARTAALTAAALGLLLTTTACGGGGTSTGSERTLPVSQAGTATPTPAAPVATPAPPALADGTYEVHVVSSADGSLVLDEGRFVVGEPVEPGVDSTAPITFDTGAADEQVAAPVADDARLRLHVSGSGATDVAYPDVAAAVEASTGPFLATVEILDGEVALLEELYRA